MSASPSPEQLRTLEANLATATSDQQAAAALNALAAAWHPLEARHALSYAEAAAARAEAAGDVGALAASLIYQAIAHVWQHNIVAGLSLGERSLALWQRLNNPAGEAQALSTLSWAHWCQGRLTRSAALGQIALDLARTCQSLPLEAEALGRFGLIYAEAEAYAAAQSVWAEAAGLYRALGDLAGERQARLYAALAYLDLGQPAEAAAILATIGPLDDLAPVPLGFYWLVQGRWLAGAGRSAESAAALQNAVACGDQTQYAGLQLPALLAAGRYLPPDHAPDQVEALLQQALALANDLEHAHYQSLCRLALSEIRVGAGDQPGAMQHLREYLRAQAVSLTETRAVCLPPLGPAPSSPAVEPLLATARRLKQAVHDRDTRLRTIFDLSPSGLAVTGPDQTWQQVNPKLCELLGYPPAALLGRPWPEITHPDDFAAEMVHFHRALAGEIDDYVLNKRFIRSDGAIVWVRLSARCQRRPDRSVDSFLVLIENISEHKYQADLNAALARLAQAALSIPVAELLRQTVDEAERLTASRIGFCHFLEADQINLTLQAWSTQTLAVYCQAPDQASHYPLDRAGIWADCIRRRAPVIHNDLTALAERKGLPPGHAQVIRELVVPVLDKERIAAVLGVGNKLTPYTGADIGVLTQLATLAWQFVERHRVEQALRQSEHRLQAVFESNSDGMLVVDQAGRIQLANQAAAHVLGLPPGRLTSQHFGFPIADANSTEVEVVGGDQQLRALEMRVNNITNEGHHTYLVSLRDLSDHKRLEEVLRLQATTDGLTGVSNRRHFFELSEREIKRAIRRHHALVLALIDIDHFKAINDTYGHAAGDVALSELVQVLSKNLRDMDILARLGGDEFVVLLPETDLNQARTAIERLRRALSRHPLSTIDETLRLKISVGLAALAGEQDTLDTLLVRADHALYAAKHAGRDSVQTEPPPAGAA